MLRSSSRNAVRLMSFLTPKTATKNMLMKFPPTIRKFSTIYDQIVFPEDTNVHRSNAEELIAKVPVIEIDADLAVCDGGGGALGHPVEYIQLHTVRAGEPQTCKYCGLRFQQKKH